MDYDSEVLYVYEVQVENSTWRKGLGKFMMQVSGAKLPLPIFKNCSDPENLKMFTKNTLARLE